MKLSTKAIASLMVVTAVAAAVPGVSQISITRKKRESRFDKLFATHDRKGEIRASILGISPNEFRELRRTHSLEQIIRQSGFRSKRAFRVALLGYLRGELTGRGWTRQRIDGYITSRAYRFA